MYEMTLHVDLSRCWIGKVKDQFPVDVTLIDTIPMENDKHGVQDLVDIDLNGTDPDEISDLIRSLEGIDFLSVSGNEGTKVKMIVGTSSCIGCRAIADAEAFLLFAKVLDKGWVEWRLVHNTIGSLENLRTKLESSGMKNRLISISEYKDKDSLSKEQERILNVALEMGYFNFPKSVGIRELSRTLGVSTAYISYTLRSAQKRAIELYFKR